MVKINLIAKKKRQDSARNWVVLGLAAVFLIFTIYFLGTSIYVVSRLFLIRNEQTKVDTEAETISKEMTSNSQLLQGFVLSKFILTKVQSLNSEKFPYSQYLDQISGFLPSNGSLKNVDFANKGWVAVVADIPGGIALKQLETNLSDPNQVGASGFNSIYAESLSKGASGLYSAKLQFEIKKNGGN